MATKDSAKKLKPEPPKRYTAVDRNVGLKDLTDSEKLLLGYIAGWEGKGCYAANATIAGILDTNERSIRRRIQVLKAKGYILMRGDNGKGRQMWAKSCPAAGAGIAIWDKKHRPNPARCGHVETPEPGQMRPANPARCGRHTRPDVATNDTTNENKMIASPTPSPAKRSSATLKRVREGLTANEINERKERQIRELLATEKRGRFR